MKFLRKKGQTLWEMGIFLLRKILKVIKIAERNSLVRPPIVNIDQAVVIMSAKEPD